MSAMLWFADLVYVFLQDGAELCFFVFWNAVYDALYHIIAELMLRQKDKPKLILQLLFWIADEPLG